MSTKTKEEIVIDSNKQSDSRKPSPVLSFEQIPCLLDLLYWTEEHIKSHRLTSLRWSLTHKGEVKKVTFKFNEGTKHAEETEIPSAGTYTTPKPNRCFRIPTANEDHIDEWQFSTVKNKLYRIRLFSKTSEESMRIIGETSTDVLMPLVPIRPIKELTQFNTESRDNLLVKRVIQGSMTLRSTKYEEEKKMSTIKFNNDDVVTFNSELKTRRQAVAIKPKLQSPRFS